MTMQMSKEMFTGKYDSMSPSVLLPVGFISGGKNIRKIGDFGGWKSRMGSTLHNTAAISAHEIKSLIHYIHPRNSDSHFFAHLNNKIYEMTNDPPTAGAGTGTDLSVTTVNNQLFSDVVGDLLFIGDGGVSPLTWGGDTPFCKCFLLYLDASSVLTDYTRWTTDNRTDTYATLPGNAADDLFICTNERATGFKFTMGSTVNANSVTMTVAAWRGGSYTAVSNQSDGTADSGATLAQTGTVTWDYSASDDLLLSEGVMGFWYRITFSGALTANVKITKVQTVYSMQRMTNKWDGVMQWIGAARYYDGTNYNSVTGLVTNESTSQYLDLAAGTTSYYLYVKAPEPITAIGFGIDADYPNAEAAEIDLIEFWDGDSWVSVSTFFDGSTNGTSSFAQTGILRWDASNYATPVRRTFGFDAIPGFWYRVSWDATLSTEVRVWGITYAPYPEALSVVDGCIEFKGRLMVWGDPEFPNRLRYSAKNAPDCFCGADSGYTEQFGDMSPIINVKKFYNELLIFKTHEVYLLEGYSGATFGSLRLSTTCGLASPAACEVVETGVAIMHTNEVLSVAIWLDEDGIYMLDGRKPKKVSLPVDRFFNPEYSECLSVTNKKNRKSFIDKTNNEFHLLLPDGELVYNYIRDEWYPKWERYVDLTCGLNFRASNGQYYTYGGCSTGFIYRLENGTVDKDTSNADQTISAVVKSRAIAAQQDRTTTLRLTFRKLWTEAKQATGATLATVIYPDLATSGTTLNVPSAMSLARANFGIVTPLVYDRLENVSCFELEFTSTGAILELYSMLYVLETSGELFNVV